MHRIPQADSRAGLLYGLAAYGLWGLMPLYFAAVTGVPPLELLAHRIVWSVVLLAGVITLAGRWRAVGACLAAPRTRWMLLASTLLIAANWFLFIYGVSIGEVVQNSLGYFINPLLNILLGVLLFREHLRRPQWLALLLATAGLVYLVVALGEVPWISLALACSFAAYGLIRKVVPVDALVGLTVETLLLFPVTLGYLAYCHAQGQAKFGSLGFCVDALLIASGLVTTVPLLCFGEAARRVRLSTLGFLQYLAPMLQFLLAVLWLGEPFSPERQVAFTLIWSALALVTFDSLWRRWERRAPDARRTPEPMVTPGLRRSSSTRQPGTPGHTGRS